ncbi:Hypothetical predicted protein [Xyrichtys novacula]|uniref:Uncharacterized protein n=1 Tax=Xyrichtys novacula TaxID=13765 RepID=A0AAV1GTX3_XYRNO|nr:Hypothetical predicted protein [Xyrichtys novacula]
MFSSAYSGYTPPSSFCLQTPTVSLCVHVNTAHHYSAIKRKLLTDITDFSLGVSGFVVHTPSHFRSGRFLSLNSDGAGDGVLISADTNSRVRAPPGCDLFSFFKVIYSGIWTRLRSDFPRFTFLMNMSACSHRQTAPCCH